MALNLFVLVLLVILLADYLKKNRHAFRRKLFCVFVATNVLPLLVSIFAYFSTTRLASLICNLLLLLNTLCILGSYMLFLYSERLLQQLNLSRQILRTVILFICFATIIILYPFRNSEELNVFTGSLILMMTLIVTVSLFVRVFRHTQVSWNVKAACPIFFFSVLLDMLTPKEHLLPAGISLILILIHFYRTTDHLITDALTGALNRRKLELDGNHLFPATQEVIVFMMDVDKFKKINDTYGHETGDRVLQDVVVTIKNIIRPKDCFFRIGGDEFLLLVANSSDTDLAENILARINSGFDEFNKKCSYLDFSITLSIGHTTAKGNQILEVLARADQKMYEKKQKKAPL